MRLNRVQTCLISALGTSRTVKIYKRLEFYDSESLFISAIFSEVVPNHPKIITDSKGSIEFLDESLSKSIINSNSYDQNNMGSILSHMPSLFFDFFEDQQPKRRKISLNESISIESKKKVRHVDVLFFQSKGHISMFNSIYQISTEVYRLNKSYSKRKSSLSAERRSVSRGRSNASEVSTGDNLKEFNSYLSEISEAYYCRLEVDSYDYACCLRTLLLSGMNAFQFRHIFKLSDETLNFIKDQLKEVPSDLFERTPKDFINQFLTSKFPNQLEIGQGIGERTISRSFHTEEDNRIFLIKDESQLHGSSGSESKQALKPFSSHHSSKKSTNRSNKSVNSMINKFGNHLIFDMDMLEVAEQKIRRPSRQLGTTPGALYKDATVTYLTQIIEPDHKVEEVDQSQADIGSIGGFKQDRRYLFRKNSQRFQLLVK